MLGNKRRLRARAFSVMALVVGGLILAACPAPPTEPTGPPTTVPPPLPVDSFVAVPMISGLQQAVNVEFAPDGRVFVAEKSGIIKTYDSIDDTTATVAADLRAPVRSIGDHGLLGMAVDPDHPAEPYLYAFFTWDSTGLWGDGCAAGYAENGCVTGGRIVRLELDAAGLAVGAPQTIVDDRWCFQFTSHGVGDLQFLADGTLLASAGEGAHVAGIDYGQYGGQPTFPPIPYVTPRNGCGDPPGGVGGPVASNTAEGGAFRSQDLLTPGDPTGWNGAIVRIDPDTGLAPADNPLVGTGAVDDDEVVAHGLRNPYRFAIRPGTDEVYIADVGRNHYEEIDRTLPLDGVVENFGWPCKEGPIDQPSWSALNNTMCTLMHSPTAPTTLTGPWFHYSHAGGGASLGGIEFVPTQGRYPAEHEGAVIYSDYVRASVATLQIGTDGQPVPEGATVVVEDTITVDIEAGPDGYVYTVDYVNGTVNRLVHADAAPVAKLTADATTGQLPLTVQFDASASSDPDGGALTFEWDLDGDGEYDDGTAPTASTPFTTAAHVVVGGRVSDESGAAAVASVTVRPGNTAPEVDIQVTTPLPWSANDDITFEITATDAEDGTLDDTAIEWEALIYHCATEHDCHLHPYTEGSEESTATIAGPSHGFPSYLVLRATATDSRGHTTEVSQELHPATATLEVTSTPSGATVAVGEESRVTPFTITVIDNDQLTISVPTPQTIGGTPYQFDSWAHGGAQSHDYIAESDASLHLTLSP